MRGARIVVSVVLAGSPSACNAILDIEKPNVVTDAGAADGASSPDVATDGGVVAGNLLSNGDLERGCSEWVGGEKVVGKGRNGTDACMLCGATDQSVFALVQVLGERTFAAGEYFEGEAWVHAPESGVAAGSVGLELVLSSDKGPDYIQGGASIKAPAVTTEWKKTTATLTVEPGSVPAANELVVSIVSREAGRGGCVLVDDVSVVKR